MGTVFEKGTAGGNIAHSAFMAASEVCSSLVMPKLPVIPDDITLAQFLLDYAHPLKPARRDVPCLIDQKSGRAVMLEELRTSTSALANSLYSMFQLGDHDIGMIYSFNHINYPIALWAMMKLGMTVSCSNPRFTTEELAYQLRVSGSTFVIAHSTNFPFALAAAQLVGIPLRRVILIDSLRVRDQDSPCIESLIQDGIRCNIVFKERTLDPGEGSRKVALLSWSSGTTGKPKAVAISHKAIIANLIQMAVHNRVHEPCSCRDAWGYRPGDIASGVLPFFHVAGLILNLHFVLLCGMSIVIAENYEPLDFLDTIIRHRVTHLLLVPPQAINLCKHPAIPTYDLSAVRYLLIGAAPVAKEVQNQLYELFPDAQIGQAYGMTEMTTTLAMVSGRQKRGPLGSGGRLLPGIESKVIKADGSLAACGEQGELVVRGPAISLGYPNDRKATRETFVDGWVYTGDQVVISADNEVFVVDRTKEFLKVRGFQVAPAELEGCILDHGEVVECCVVGVPDDYSGELPLAFVVLSSDARDRVQLSPTSGFRITSSIIKHVADRKTDYKHLKGGVLFVDEIPKTGSGKLLRRVLRERARDLVATKQRARL